MFEDVRKEDDKKLATPPGKIEDMFAPVDPTPDMKSAVQSGRLTTVDGQTPQTPPASGSPSGTRIGPPDPLTHLSQIDTWSGKRSKRGMLFSLVALLLIAGGAAAAYFFFLAPKDLPIQTDTNTDQNTPVNTNSSENTNSDSQIPSNALIDSDGDELTDVEEQSFNTDPTSVDTDSDGLSDKDEIRVYKTNPLLSDTDNDGLLDRDELLSWRSDPNDPDTDDDTYLDGAEVQNGYDPNGPGKLAPSL